MAYDRDLGYEKGKRVQTGPLDYHEASKGTDARTSAENIVDVSGQGYAGRAFVPPADTSATIEDDDGIATPIAPMRLDPSADEEEPSGKAAAAGK